MNQEQNNFNSLGPKPEFSTQPTENNVPQPNPQVVQQPVQPVPQPMYQQPVQQPMPQPMYQQPMYNQPPKKKSNAWIFILLAVLGFFLVVGLVIFFLLKGVFNAVKDEIATADYTFQGDGYTFNYDYSWTEGKSGEKQALKSSKNNSMLVAVGVSALDEEISCDFEETTCQKKLYNDFYNFWMTDADNASMTLITNDKVFEKLVDDVYIAYYKYGKSSKNIKGYYYLLASKEKNTLISFYLSSDSNLDDADKEVRKMLETIEIEEKELTGKAEEKELAEQLDKMSNWNMYSSVRLSNTLSLQKTLEGGWLILSDSSVYWKFTANEFYWYKSHDDLNDNYWYGTYTVKTGKEGLESVGIEPEKLDTIIANSKGKVTEKDVYAVVLSPQKIISDGVDKSDTNLSPGTIWKYVWILVDHGKDGIEAQVLNLGSSDTSYYVKIIG